MKKNDLIKVAKEINDVFGCNPAIKESGDPELIETGIKEALELIEPDDTFSPDATKLLEDFGVFQDKEDNFILPINWNRTKKDKNDVKEKSEKSSDYEKHDEKISKIDLYKSFIYPLICNEKNTKMEIENKFINQYPFIKKKEVSIFLSHAKNKKYKSFEKIVKMRKKTKILYFAK